MTDLTRDLVDAVGDAFNANDIDAVMQFFAPDAKINVVHRRWCRGMGAIHERCLSLTMVRMICLRRRTFG